MPINNLTNSNTFFEWLTATNQLISPVNALVDGPILLANTSLRLTAPGISLNVSNNSLLNIVYSNVVTVNTVSGNGLYVLGNANVARNVYTGNVFTTRIYFSGGGSMGGISDLTLPVTFPYVSTTANANVGTHLVVNQYIWQRGANATFNGAVLFSNTTASESINSLGNILTFGNLTVSKNTITSNLTVNVTTKVATLNVDTIVQPTGTGSVKFQANTQYLGSDKTLKVDQGILDLETANTKLGPYTEKVFVDATVNGNRSLDLKTASFFNLTITTAAATLTVINPPASGTMGSATLVIKSGIAGATASFAAQRVNGTAGTIRWPYNTPPVLTTTLNAVNVINLFTVDGGVNWYGSAPILGSTG